MSSKRALPGKLEFQHIPRIKADPDTRLRDSEELSDCTLICGPYHFNLHKFALASQSDYFKTAFKKGTFKVWSRYFEPQHSHIYVKSHANVR